MNKSSELAVVQFIHPGGEHKVGRDGWTPWNQRSHRRKFMLLDGSCVDGHGRTHTGRLVAWGEWEAPSRLVTRVTPPSGNTRIRTGLPDAIVSPVFPGPAAPAPGLQNTDPNIFGDCFRYTLCGQMSVRTGARKFLVRLEAGSLVLFGTRIGGQFLLDTALVVGRSPIRHSRHTWPDALDGLVSDVYRAVTIEPMYGDPAARDDFEFSFYAGATLERPMHGMYSFFPCMPVDRDEMPVFARPAIEVDGFVSSAQNQGQKRTITDPETIRSVWQQIVDQVFDAGLQLGVHAVEPTVSEVPGHVWPGRAAADAATTSRRAGC